MNDVDPSGKTAGERPAIAKAARTIAESMGLADTMVDVLRARAFQPYAEALRQYMTIRLGSVIDGADALTELRLLVAGERATQLIAPPGVRGQLYARARQLVAVRWEQGSGFGSDARSRLPWRKPPTGISIRYRSALAQIRQELTEGDAELLELRFSRELETEELAFVLDFSIDEVEQRLEGALAQAKRLVEGLYPDLEHELGTLLLEAFALDPLPEQVVGAPSLAVSGLAEGTIIGERYEVEEQVGSGGMGSVYRAIDTEVPDHVVALKLLHQAATSDAARLAALRELHLIASVFHPSVVQFKDHGWHEGRLWFVMPWYEGETLERRLKRMPLTRDEARPIFQQLSRALATMHTVGVRHQDIKPDNILLAKIEGLGLAQDQQYLPVLLDLGVAAKEAELVLAGTPIYFAPEVAAQYARVSEPHPVTSKADVFSLCLSLRNALSPESQEVVTAGAVEHFIEQRAENPPDPPRSDDLDFLKPHFERWLSVDPKKRPTAEELAEELVVLTQPEDQHARRMALFRLLGPLMLAVIAVFAAVVFGFARHAESQKRAAAEAELHAQEARVVAELAKTEALVVREDLSEAEEQLQTLELEISKTLKTSKLSQEELTQKLARAESVSQVLQKELTGMQRRAVGFRDQRDEARGERDKVQQDNLRLEGDLRSSRAQAVKLGQTIDDLRERLTGVRGELASAEQQVAGLSARVSNLEDQLGRERASKARLESQLAQAEASNAQAQGQLAAARRNVERIEARLAAAETARDTASSQLAQARLQVAQLERQLAQCRSKAVPNTKIKGPTSPVPVRIRPKAGTTE